MKVYFTPEEMHTDEYREYVRWVGECWRLNDERNQRDLRHLRLKEEQQRAA